MNLLIIKPEEINDDQIVTLNDRRFLHIKNVHKAVLGQQLKAGLLNGKSGFAEIIEISEQQVRLTLSLNKPPIAVTPITLILALPRPKMLKRILQSVSSLGIKKIYLINSYRVDKSYWSTPVLTASSIEENLILGIEQSGDTLLPEVILKKRFKPFVEDELVSIIKDSTALVAHPYNAQAFPQNLTEHTTLAIGPEGGFIQYEVDKLEAIGFNSVTLGQRILKVETAIPVAVSKLAY